MFCTMLNLKPAVDGIISNCQKSMQIYCLPENPFVTTAYYMHVSMQCEIAGVYVAK